MNRMLKRLSIIFGTIFIGWVLLLAFSTDYLFYGFYGWAGFCGSVLAFGLSAASMLLWEPDGGRDTTEINAAPLVYTSTYFIAMLVANTVFCFLTYANYPKVIPIAVNLLLTVAFVTVRVFILPYRNRVLQTTAHAAEKTRGVVELSSKLGQMLGAVQDDAVKKRLKELKEQLDYSTNVSQPFTADLEERFFNQLCELSNAIDKNVPAEEVLKKIDAAQITWKKRNGASSMN